MAGNTSLLGEVVQNKKGEKVRSSVLFAEGKIVGIYFSAHWCPPCRGFTPKLIEWYNKQEEGKLEIVFVSSDRDQASFDGYYNEMPWACLPFDESDIKDAVSKEFGVRGIPTLVFLNSNGELITKDGRAKVMENVSATDLQ